MPTSPSKLRNWRTSSVPASSTTRDLLSTAPTFVHIPDTQDQEGYAFEVFLGCLLGALFPETRFVEPPDLVLPDGSNRWGLACKCAGQDTTERVLVKAILKGAKQVEESSASAGAVVVEVSRRPLLPDPRVRMGGRDGVAAFNTFGPAEFIALRRSAELQLGSLVRRLIRGQPATHLAGRPKVLSVFFLGCFQILVQQPTDPAPVGLTFPLVLEYRTPAGDRHPEAERLRWLIARAYALTGFAPAGGTPTQDGPTSTSGNPPPGDSTR